MTAVVWIAISIVAVILGWTLVETLVWWQLWRKDGENCSQICNDWHDAVIFLTGISNYASSELAPEQQNFLRELSSLITADAIVCEPFPYCHSIAHNFSKFQIWRYVRGDRELPLWLMSVYNFWQTILVTFWEQAYGKGVAQRIIDRLDLSVATDRHLWIICGSTGAGIALAAVPFLQVNVTIIAIGGVYRASSGFDRVARFYDLQGDRDIWVKLGKWIFPRRWLCLGALDRAIGERRYRFQSTGNHRHLEYLSDRIDANSGKTNRQLLLHALGNIITNY